MKTPGQKARNAAYMARWRKAHPEETKKRAKAWYVAHRELANGRSRLYVLAHPEKAREAYKRWNAAHPGVQRQHSKKWFDAHREEAAATNRRWAEAHPESRRATTNRRRARRIGSGGSHTSAEWIALCETSGWVCAYCHTSLNMNTATRDHKIPLSRDGSDGIDNIALSCLSCNCRKWVYTAEEYLAKRAVA